jgi:hypothetical protein
MHLAPPPYNTTKMQDHTATPSDDSTMQQMPYAPPPIQPARLLSCYPAAQQHLHSFWHLSERGLQPDSQTTEIPSNLPQTEMMPHACRRRVLGHSSESQAATPGMQYGVLWCIQIDSQSTYNISTHKHCLGTARRHTKPLETTQKVYRASHRDYIGLDLTRGLHRRNTSCMPPSLVNITKAKNAAKPSPVKLSNTTHSTDPSHMV